MKRPSKKRLRQSLQLIQPTRREGLSTTLQSLKEAEAQLNSRVTRFIFWWVIGPIFLIRLVIEGFGWVGTLLGPLICKIRGHRFYDIPIKTSAAPDAPIVGYSGEQRCDTCTAGRKAPWSTAH